MRQNCLLQGQHLLVVEVLLSLLPLFVPLGHGFHHMSLKGTLGGLKGLLVSEFLGLCFPNRGLELLRFCITMLSGVLLDGSLLFFSDGSGPQLDFSELLLFVFFDLFSFLFEHSLIILNHCVVVYSVWVLFELFDLVFADLLVTLDGQCIENFHCFGLSLLLKRLQECVSCSSLFISDLLLFKLTLLTGCLCLLLLLLVESILLSLVCELLLDCCHFLLLLLHLIDFFIELLLDFHEDTLSLGLAVGGGLDHALEYLTQLIAKREQVLSDLSLWVESHRALSTVGVIVDGSMHKTFSIAFVEQLFNLCD